LSRVLWKVRSKAPTVTASVKGTVLATGEGYTTIRDSTPSPERKGSLCAVTAGLHSPLTSWQRPFSCGVSLITNRSRNRDDRN
ncbi:hypothetical protein, partial [Micrococcus luteus]|uniref:hypothetical protein n=1 Tax=Micrococcus luteus TaxID=1270 RepID=UPI003017A336